MIGNGRQSGGGGVTRFGGGGRRTEKSHGAAAVARCVVGVCRATFIGPLNAQCNHSHNNNNNNNHENDNNNSTAIAFSGIQHSAFIGTISCSKWVSMISRTASPDVTGVWWPIDCDSAFVISVASAASSTTD
ncbi:hypothetical protein TYRP_010598 [Tyrophagus putrescentiae]|nr:hypothetical protein TYRP_010598 [Tyrophagus putrescentiae]